MSDPSGKNKRKVMLEVKGISKHFGGIKAVDDIDLKLHKGEIIAIVGDNGAGKSTLIKMISLIVNGIAHLGISTYWSSTVTGSIMIMAVAIDYVSKRNYNKDRAGF